MLESLFHLQQHPFQAARQLSRAPAGHPQFRRHGHGFALMAAVAVTDGVPEAASKGWRPALQAAAAALDYQDLDACVADPSDEGLLAHLARSLPEGALLSLRSAPGQGVRRDAGGQLHAWASWRFEAAHRLPHVPVGHKCGRLHGHGFRAVVHAPLRAAGSGWGADHARLQAAWAPLHAQLHERCLNELPGLENPTSEWLAVWIWRALQAALGSGCWVSVYETAGCGAHYDGLQHHIWKDFTLDSATRADGRVLGHTYTARLHLSGTLHPQFGWAQDFADVKAVFDPVFRALDHRPLHELDGLGAADPAALAHYIRGATRESLPALARVDVLDGCGQGASLVWGGCPLQPLPEG